MLEGARTEQLRSRIGMQFSAVISGLDDHNHKQLLHVCTTRAHSKVEGEAQFGPRPQDKTSSEAPLAQYFHSSYVAITHALIVDVVRLCLSA